MRRRPRRRPDGSTMRAAPTSARFRCRRTARFCYRELGQVEKRAGNADRRSSICAARSSSMPTTRLHWSRRESCSEARGDTAGAEDAYRKAAAIEPSLNLAAPNRGDGRACSRIAPAAGISCGAHGAAMTRGDLAALIGVRLEGLLRRAPTRQVVVTDTAEALGRSMDHRRSTQRGDHRAVREPYLPAGGQRPPRRPGNCGEPARRVDCRVESVSSRTFERSVRRSPTCHPVTFDTDAVVSAVVTGVMPLVEGDRFLVSRQVSGEEAVEVDRSRAGAAATTLGVSRQ